MIMSEASTTQPLLPEIPTSNEVQERKTEDVLKCSRLSIAKGSLDVMLIRERGQWLSYVKPMLRKVVSSLALDSIYK